MPIVPMLNLITSGSYPEHCEEFPFLDPNELAEFLLKIVQSLVVPPHCMTTMFALRDNFWFVEFNLLAKSTCAGFHLFCCTLNSNFSVSRDTIRNSFAEKD